MTAASDFVHPIVRLGDMVYWYNDPMNPADPQVGWVCRRPGVNTVTILVFAPDSGFLEKPSVRHRDDPGLSENVMWRTWGCWEFSPMSKELARLREMTSNMAINFEREAKKSHGSK